MNNKAVKMGLPLALVCVIMVSPAKEKNVAETRFKIWAAKL